MRARVEELKNRLRCCNTCPHHCEVDRLAGERGFCRTGSNPVVASYGPHFGEESVLVGSKGSGTIFFTYCVMRCVFCQNFEISQLGEGEEITTEALADIMISLQRRGCHNINLVSPTHVIPMIVEAVYLAVPKGLAVPLVYNTGGYEDVATLKLLDSIIDIYMPDVKFADNQKARKYTGCRSYFDVAKAAIREMHRQVGDLKIDSQGLAVKGLLVRHLVLPNNLADSEAVLKFLAEDISPNTVVNIMAQYHPAYRTSHYPELARRIRREEYAHVVEFARALGMDRAMFSLW
ncbi:MAG: radical SAM protein [Syntrophothermus sp.]|nr:radical SAM protein [Syntrophothermus sp.]